MNRLLLTGLVAASFLLSGRAQALPSVAVYGGTDGLSGTAHIANELAATGDFSSVTILNGTESPATLSSYTSILFYTNVGGDMHFANEMANYVTGGGHLVAATFLWQANAMGGNNGLGTLAPLLPFTGYNGNYITQVNLVPNIASSPLLTGVGSISAFYHDQTSLSPGATLVASWSDGSPAVAVNADGVVGVNLFPNDAYGYVYGNYVQLFADALDPANTMATLALAGSQTPEPASAALLAAGLGLLGYTRRRRA
jgi:hypothetical protein